MRVTVVDDTIDRWVRGLLLAGVGGASDAEAVQIVSLLGTKNNGFSEFGYYPFRSTHETGAKLTFQEWLERKYPLRFAVREFPTVDAQGIPRSKLELVKRSVLDLLKNSSVVVVVDSTGAERSSRVCEAIGYTKIPRP